MNQPSGDIIASEGDSVTLGCTFETTGTYPYLFWYKQDIGDIPKYMMKCYSKYVFKDHDFDNDRFTSSITETSVPLKIQKLHLSDSAVYYCAVRPTVTGNTKTLNKNLWT